MKCVTPYSSQVRRRWSRSSRLPSTNPTREVLAPSTRGQRSGGGLTSNATAFTPRSRRARRTQVPMNPQPPVTTTTSFMNTPVPVRDLRDFPRSAGQDVLHDVPVDVREALITAAVAERQSGVVE